MARNRQSVVEFFDGIKNYMQHHGNCRFEKYEDFPEPSTDGHPIDLKRATFALTHTAKTCLGDDHGIYLHSFGYSKPVGTQLLLIAAECKAAPQCRVHAQEDLGVDVHGVFVTAYMFADDLRSLERTLRNHSSPVILNNRAIAA